ncbi:MAG: SMC-Scp complex subunit ScpB [Kiritimatiellae bacterium]|nr:SMC-Scp complex subunit ScpB [Kiritimatiellia bacterium]
MTEGAAIPELKAIVGALLFVSRTPISVDRLAQVFRQTAERLGGVAAGFAEVGREEIVAAIEAVRKDLATAGVGLRVAEVAQGYRIESEPACGPWVRVHLDRLRPQRLSPPALETLAIIAYRQPVTRAEIEAVRGVAVDQILRNLLDLQLIRVTGRSDLPGRPWLFGTTQRFLEHFGLNRIDDLPGVDELRRREAGYGGPPEAASTATAGGPEESAVAEARTKGESSG